MQCYFRKCLEFLSQFSVRNIYIFLDFAALRMPHAFWAQWFTMFCVHRYLWMFMCVIVMCCLLFMLSVLTFSYCGCWWLDQPEAASILFRLIVQSKLTHLCWLECNAIVFCIYVSSLTAYMTLMCAFLFRNIIWYASYLITTTHPRVFPCLPLDRISLLRADWPILWWADWAWRMGCWRY